MEFASSAAIWIVVRGARSLAALALCFAWLAGALDGHASAQVRSTDESGGGAAGGDLVVGPGGAELCDYVKRLAQLGAFSGSVLVARGDTVLLDGGFGLADQRRGIPVTRATVFDIGSVAKQFAAAAVLRLELDGRLRVDETLARLFPEAATDKREITLHQLLTHTSGLPGDLEASGNRTTRPDDPGLAAQVLALPLESAPGTTFRYSNAGYVLLRLAIERASSVPFARYVTESLLRPAGLERTGWHGDAHLWRADEVARGTSGLHDSGSPRDWPLHGATFGAGEMVSSPGELFRWLRALDSGAVLPKEACEKLFTPRTRWSGLGAEGRGSNALYAYGWEVRTREDGTIGLVFHNGTYDNFRTTVRRYPRDDAVIIVATHARQQDAGDRADDLANALRDIMVGTDVALPPTTIEVRSAQLAELEGTYEFPTGASFDLWRATPDRLWLAPHGQDAFDHVWSPSPNQAAHNERVAQRTLEFIQTLRTGTSSAETADWSAMFSAWVERFGPCERVELEGVAPLTWSEDGALSYTVLDFERGRLVVTWEWFGDRLAKTMSADDVVQPQSIPLAPIGPGSFLAYDAFTGRSLQLEFAAESGARTVVVGAGADETRATRSSSRATSR